MGMLRVVLLQGGRIICHHSEVFHGTVLNYPTYDKELHVMVKYVNNWKHYLMGKKIVVHIDHWMLQYL